MANIITNKKETVIRIELTLDLISQEAYALATVLSRSNPLIARDITSALKDVGIDWESKDNPFKRTTGWINL